MPKTILIVEDNIASMKLFRDLLQEAGYNLLLAKDGMEGIRMVRNHNPHLILLDFLLPKLSGYMVINMIKSDVALKVIPVIATTAFPFEGDDQAFQEWGFDDYILKPINIPDFLKTVSRHLN